MADNAATLSVDGLGLSCWRRTLGAGENNIQDNNKGDGDRGAGKITDPALGRC
jgi:hypothetical protein